ncbi:MAG: D-isomer specific 2-hydroxyacid dehydrogenase family protein [Acidimicrobiia bacterium]|nr:D-isomer specific 2-hydroxyacid dehydrogenase family protein [Acidimicrobiia bacterium]
MASPVIAVAPDTLPVMHRALVDAVREGGAEVGPLSDAEGLVWADPGAADAFPTVIAEGSGVRWIQLPYAGIEPFAHHLDTDHVWTCGKGVYAAPVAEHALTLGLAGLRRLDRYARADRWEAPVGTNLLGGTVTIIGAGGIATELIGLLAPFGAAVRVVRRRDEPFTGAEVVPFQRAHQALPGADLVVIACALTAETTGLVDGDFLAAMEPHAWLVNVGRGGHVVTGDLVDALDARVIGGAGLDVTDPEPLPQGHPLWSRPNCIITPHIANTPEMGLPLLAERVRDNVERWCQGEDLIGLVDVEAGY